MVNKGGTYWTDLSYKDSWYILHSRVFMYSFLFNTSHVVLGDMPDFFQKHVWITRHAILQIT